MWLSLYSLWAGALAPHPIAYHTVCIYTVSNNRISNQSLQLFSVSIGYSGKACDWSALASPSSSMSSAGNTEKSTSGEVAQRSAVSVQPNTMNVDGGSVSNSSGGGVDGRSVISDFLRAHTCYDLMHDSGKAVVFDTKIGVNLAFFALAEHNIKAVPLWDTDRQQLVGMLTASDFVDIIRHFYYDSSTNSIMDKLSSISIDQWRSMTNRRHSELLSISPEDSLHAACRFLIQHKLHRLPIIDPVHQNVLRVMTHLRVLEYLVSVFRDDRPLFEGTIEDMGVGKFDHVITLPAATPLIQVLDTLSKHRLSAVPLLDENGVAVDIYCRTNATLLAHEGQLLLLEMPVGELLARQRAEGFAADRFVTCRRNDRLRSVLEMFATARVHRLVCVDDEGRPQGIVSLSDLFGYFVQ